MNRTKIEWCDFTWNPVWGCKSLFLLLCKKDSKEVFK